MGMVGTRKKIENVQDIIEVEPLIIGQLVKGKLTYFNLVVEEESATSNCYFTPTSQLQKTEKRMIMVDDYAKVLMALLSHPYIEDLEYDQEANMIFGVFKNPYAEEYMEEQRKIEYGLY